ncbi:hypothetical protein BGW36DRAFT_465590 [Talaromyces proteolyticus]|uniref:Transcription factor domain-containing protein n=1 Tax=Talaromyces proteolyticus TaxID=1131652 RepID=A0AAD4PTF2_9EURO|nr:uncharacterized protein BGW36DRAFT_465590 [Talaromyces proteolyticus]KAH8690711.1 hypothetical protein BGW36DRAFT_465590 [Talaromyces proteolyticus]
MACNLKQIIIRHFVEHYYSLILLPNCHPGFYDGWLNEIQDLMVHHKSLFYSVLACAASHLHFIDGSSQMHHLALTCYSTSLKEVSHLLAKTSRLENHNGLLMSVMLLYLHGVRFPVHVLIIEVQCIGCDTIADIPCHVNAAARILAMRLFRRSININGLFDRLAIESVLYQTFLVMTGLWSEPTRLDFHFDPRFWMKAEKLLTQSTCFPEGSTSLNSPVLGVPVSFFRLGILLRQQYLDSLPRKSAIIDQLQPEVKAWQATLFYNYRTRINDNYDKFISEETYYRDASYLYIIIISVLLEQLSRMETTIGPTPMESSDCWQINTAVEILQSHRFDTGWSRCFIGNWPVYTLGFLISSPEDKKLVLADLENRWDKQRSTQVNRFKIDLENTWASRKEYSSID